MHNGCWDVHVRSGDMLIRVGEIWDTGVEYESQCLRWLGGSYLYAYDGFILAAAPQRSLLRVLESCFPTPSPSVFFQIESGGRIDDSSKCPKLGIQNQMLDTKQFMYQLRGHCVDLDVQLGDSAGSDLGIVEVGSSYNTLSFFRVHGLSSLSRECTLSFSVAWIARRCLCNLTLRALRLWHSP